MAIFAVNYRKMSMTMNEDKQMSVTAEQENRTENTPVSMLDYIPQMSGSKGFVVNINNRWLNGKEGAITDARGDNHYRFYLMRNSNIVYKNPEDNPIVAVGIVAYWLHHRQNNDRFATWDGLTQNYKQAIPCQYKTYTSILYENFKNKREQEPDSWRCNIEKEFYTEYIIPLVTQQNRVSAALLEYITPDDRRLVQGLMQEYLIYLNTKKMEYDKITTMSMPISYTKYDEQNEKLTIIEKEVDLSKTIEKVARSAFDKYLSEQTASDEEIDEIFEENDERITKAENETFSSTDNLSSVSESIQPISASATPANTKEEEWDDSFDFIFDERVKPQEIKRALADISRPKKISEVRFYYVSCRILEILNYLTEDALRTDFMRWINLHFKCGWPDDKEHKRRFSFALEGSSKNLEKQHPSQWDENTIKGGSGIYHHQLAIKLKNTFTQTMVNGKAVDDSDSFNKLRDRPEFLTGAKKIYDEYHVPEEAYINNGK